MESLETHPAVERLLVAVRPRVVAPPERRELVAELTASALIIAAVAAMVAAFGTEGSSPAWVLGLLIVTYALVGRARFDIGSGYTCPTELVLVPMAFAVAPALLPLVVIAGALLRRLPEVLRGRTHPMRLLITVPDAWHAVGVALVLGLANITSPSVDDWPILLAALAAQLVFDTLSGQAREWAILGVAPSLQLRMMAPIAAVDVSLAPLGFLAALAMADEPWTIVCVVPVTWLMARFAHERDERIRNALQLSSAYRGTALLMSDVLAADDEYTGGEHSHGVVILAMAVADEMNLDEHARRDLEFGSLLHDIGKLRVSNEIINKPGRLSEDEWEIVRRHPEEGQRMLERVGGTLAEVGRIVRAHHERVDGGGYPDGLAGDEIPLTARIICACDAYSAMTTDRAYRTAIPPEEAVAELRKESGRQFDPAVVEALITVLERLSAPPAAPLPVALTGA